MIRYNPRGKSFYIKSIMYFRSVQLKVTKTNKIDYFCVDERFIQLLHAVQIHPDSHARNLKMNFPRGLQFLSSVLTYKK